MTAVLNRQLSLIDTPVFPSTRFQGSKLKIVDWIWGAIEGLKFEKALDANVAYVTGRAFHADEGGHNCMRVNFTHASNDQIEEGIIRLANVIKDELALKHEAQTEEEKIRKDIIMGV